MDVHPCKAIVGVLGLFITSIANSSDSITSVSTDTIINLPIIEAWNLFTTSEGLQRIDYSRAELTLALGKHVHAERIIYTQTEIIDATITSFDPPHMISWQWTTQLCWSVLYFNAMGNDMTQVKWVDICDDAESTDLNKPALAHRNLFDQLIRRYAPECHVCKEEREAKSK